MSGREEYWDEAVGQTLCELGKFDLFTVDEIKEFGGSMAVWAENQSMAFGWDVASSNRSAQLKREEDDLRKELARERNKITCRQCNGDGWTTSHGPIHSATSQCFKCRGEGRHDP